MARPLKPVDGEKVEKLAGMGLSAELIGAFMDVSHYTIERRFAPALKRGREKRNARLTVKLFQEAMSTPCNTAIAIFLAKNYLGLTDRPEISINVQQNTVMPTRVIGLPLAELQKLVGEEYKQLANGNVEREAGGVRIVYAATP